MRRHKWRRVQPPALIISQSPGARAYQTEVEDGHLSVFVTREPIEGAYDMHLSISHRLSDGTNQPGRYPTWDEQKDAVWALAPGIAMMSILPAEGEPYVNIHDTTFHWWQYRGER